MENRDWLKFFFFLFMGLLIPVVNYLITGTPMNEHVPTYAMIIGSTVVIVDAIREEKDV